jgi:hypothetical protein
MWLDSGVRAVRATGSACAAHNAISVANNQEVARRFTASSIPRPPRHNILDFLIS